MAACIKGGIGSQTSLTFFLRCVWVSLFLCEQTTPNCGRLCSGGSLNLASKLRSGFVDASGTGVHAFPKQSMSHSMSVESGTSLSPSGRLQENIALLRGVQDAGQRGMFFFFWWVSLGRSQWGQGSVDREGMFLNLYLPRCFMECLFQWELRLADAKHSKFLQGFSGCEIGSPHFSMDALLGTGRRDEVGWGGGSFPGPLDLCVAHWCPHNLA